MQKGFHQNSYQEDPVILIKDLYKSFNHFEVLKGVNLSVSKGENLALLGRSGSGKSVLIKILVGLLKPDRGEVYVLGQRVDQAPTKELNELRLRIGFSFQSSALYDSMSIRENLEFPLVQNRKNISRDEVNKAVVEALEAVDLRDKINQMPGDLSGGQRKRIGIARTIILKPEIMLYDEPTAGLDPVTSTEINKLIKRIQQQYNTTSIIITHDLTCAKETGDRMTILMDGRFIKTGKFEEVFNTDNELIKAFYNYNFTK
jgi:phospholipid/cholesterol/gamma-HCH transport system ATP-binding protein